MTLKEEARLYHKELLARLPQLREKLPQHRCLLSEENVKRWGVGVCPPTASPSFNAWRARLVVPIFDEIGEVVALSGRRLSDSENAPKWVNNPFEKSAVLYGLHRAWRSLVVEDAALLVEGYGDVMALHAAGYPMAVAQMGSACAKRQLMLMLRYCRRVFILPDQDEAGIAGARKTALLAKTLGMKAEVLYTPEYYEDPEALVLEKPELLKDLLKGI